MVMVSKFCKINNYFLFSAMLCYIFQKKIEILFTKLGVSILQHNRIKMEQRIILNAILMTELNAKITEKMIEKLIREDTCMSVISKIEVSPMLYNKTGKYIIHLFYNLDTGKFSPI